nr:serine/threonine-protein kinase ULK3 isoform X2 [Halyomorpha halys]
MKVFIRNVYLVLEYCEGGNLSEYIRRLIRLPENICKRAIQQLAMGLAYLRLKEICHMDLKPKNLLIKYKPFTLKIADFGLSQYLSERAYTENVRGSPLYMAPEIILKKKYNYKVDLWSVGVILYECIYGKAPLKTLKAITEAMAQEIPIEYPTRVAVSEDCMSLLKGLLVYNPNQRMNFDDFFNHPFVDVVHAPTEENKKLAIHILHEAVKYDEQKKYPEAFSAYCRALRYMVPILHSLKESYEWTSMHLKVTQCLSRAEELKVSLAQCNQLEDFEECLKNDKKHSSKHIEKQWNQNVVHTGQMDIINCISSTSLEHNSKLTVLNGISPGSSGVSENSQSTDSQNTSSESSLKGTSTSISKSSKSGIDSILTRQDSSRLKDIFQSTPKVHDALEIGLTGQMYMSEGDYVTAYNKFEASLNVLIPHIKKEPPGQRKDLLVRQVQWWLTQAESAKALAAARDVDAECSLKQKIFETADCTIQ